VQGALVHTLPHNPQFAELVRVLTHLPEQHWNALSGHTLPHVPQLSGSVSRDLQLSVNGGKLPGQQDCPVEQLKIRPQEAPSSFLRDPPSIDLLTKKRLFVSLRWFSLVWAAPSTEEAAINCMDIKATKTNTVVITTGDNLKLDIFWSSPTTISGKKKRKG
jgi:hypothetical protein